MLKIIFNEFFNSKNICYLKLILQMMRAYLSQAVREVLLPLVPSLSLPSFSLSYLSSIAPLFSLLTSPSLISLPLLLSSLFSLPPLLSLVASLTLLSSPISSTLWREKTSPSMHLRSLFLMHAVERIFLSTSSLYLLSSSLLCQFYHERERINPLSLQNLSPV